jgi:hypothetical protein
MSKSAMVFFTIFLVLAGCFITGCTSLLSPGTASPSEPAQKVDVGFSPVENTVITPRYRFDEALAALSSPDSQSRWNDSEVSLSLENASDEVAFPGKHFRYIRGTDLDENGDAASWTFVVEHGDQFSMVTFNRQGMTIANSPGSIQRPEIFTDQILSPGALFEKNRAAIFNPTWSGTTVTRDLSLSGGNYTVSISGQGSPRTLVFDAKTGVLTSAND